MDFVAYNYFKTPTVTELEYITCAITNSSFQVSHLGKNDPPKKFSGTKEEIHRIISTGADATNYTFLKDQGNRLEMTVEIHNDPRWEHSTISVSGQSKALVESICVSFNQSLESFMCISGVLAQGASQAWTILHQSVNCPSLLIEKIPNA